LFRGCGHIAVRKFHGIKNGTNSLVDVAAA
jgi:hypothetical protein